MISTERRDSLNISIRKKGKRNCIMSLVKNNRTIQEIPGLTQAVTVEGEGIPVKAPPCVGNVCFSVFHQHKAGVLDPRFHAGNYPGIWWALLVVCRVPRNPGYSRERADVGVR